MRGTSTLTWGTGPWACGTTHAPLINYVEGLGTLAGKAVLDGETAVLERITNDSDVLTKYHGITGNIYYYCTRAHGVVVFIEKYSYIRKKR